MSGRTLAWTAVVVPAAAVVLLEIGLAAWTPAAGRIYALRAAGWLTLAELAGALGAAALAAVLLPVRVRSALAVATALAAALGAAFWLANGVPPLGIDTRHLGIPASLAAVIGVGGVAGGLRRVLPVPRNPTAALLFEPILLATAALGSYGVLFRERAAPAPARVLATLGTALAAGALAGWALQRLAGGRRVPPAVGAAGVPLLAAAAALAAVAAGRDPFPPLPAAHGNRPDVLLVVLDTTRADFAPAAPGARHPTPTLARLAAEGRRYTRTFSTSCWTVPSHGSLFTGLAPAAHGAGWATPRIAGGVATLAERFARAGWRTAGFSANPWVQPRFGFDRGFEQFVVGQLRPRPGRPWLAGFAPDASARLEGALAWEDKDGLGLASAVLRVLAEDAARPAFVFLNLMEAHQPYAPPRRFHGDVASAGWDPVTLARLDQDRLRDLVPGFRRSARDVEGLRLLYAAEVAYADFLVGRLVERLEESGRLDRTLLVVTADHGENLGQHAPLDHQLGLYDTLLHVPLLVRYPPRIAAGSTFDGLVSLRDVPGGLLALADGGADGGDPIAGEGRTAVHFEYDRPGQILDIIRHQLRLDPTPWDRSLHGIRSRTAKWIHASDGRHQAFDLRRDPDETENLATGPDGVPPEFAPLATSLQAERDAQPTLPRDVAESVIPADAAERLRSLGYVR